MIDAEVAPGCRVATLPDVAQLLPVTLRIELLSLQQLSDNYCRNGE